MIRKRKYMQVVMVSASSGQIMLRRAREGATGPAGSHQRENDIPSTRRSPKPSSTSLPMMFVISAPAAVEVPPDPERRSALAKISETSNDLNADPCQFDYFLKRRKVTHFVCISILRVMLSA